VLCRRPATRSSTARPSAAQATTTESTRCVASNLHCFDLYKVLLDFESFLLVFGCASHVASDHKRQVICFRFDFGIQTCRSGVGLGILYLAGRGRDSRGSLGCRVLDSSACAMSWILCCSYVCTYYCYKKVPSCSYVCTYC
jgi:hypothetical protein